MEQSTAHLTMVQAREIAFVDRSVSGLDTLLAGLWPEIEAVLLSDSQPVPEHIKTTLRGRHNLDTIHIIAHCRTREIRFGSDTLTLETLASHASELASIGEALNRNGRLLLWGCHIGTGKRDTAFVDKLAQVTSAEVDAATGLIGAASEGGNWILAIGNQAEQIKA